MPGTRILLAPNACNAVTMATISPTAWSAVRVVRPLVAKSLIPPQTTNKEPFTRPGGKEPIVALNVVVMPGRCSEPKSARRPAVNEIPYASCRTAPGVVEQRHAEARRQIFHGDRAIRVPPIPVRRLRNAEVTKKITVVGKAVTIHDDCGIIRPRWRRLSASAGLPLGVLFGKRNAEFAQHLQLQEHTDAASRLWGTVPRSGVSNR